MKRILTYQNTLKYEGKNFKTSYIQCHPRLKQTAVWANETTADGEASANTIIIEMRNFIATYKDKLTERISEVRINFKQ